MSQEINSRVIKTELIKWKELQFIQDEDFKEWINDGDKKLIESLVKYQFADPFKVWENEGKQFCLDGKHRWKDLLKLSESGIIIPDLLPATFIDCTDVKEAAELVLVYSSAYAKITQDGLFNFIEKFSLSLPDIKETLSLPDFDMFELEGKINTGEKTFDSIIPKSLQERFLVPPFSILDTRQGYWQERKKQWHSLGFNSQESREDVELIAKSGQGTAIYELRNKMRETLGRDPEWNEIIDYAKQKGLHIYEGASIFDPVLTEVCYKWFCPDGGTILDPFAGGSVRGIVASVLGYDYFGIDLRAEQISANIAQAETLKLPDRNFPVWQRGDSNNLLDDLNFQKDFVFSCPPYFDLEKYSDDPADLSNMDYETCIETYRSIIKKSIDKLKDNRFACFVVGDIRDKEGFYRNFVSDTIQAFEDAGAKLYNEIILVNVAGSLPVRIGRQFGGYRKVGKMHQNVLVFYKGDPKKIKEDFPEINIDKDLELLNNQPNIASSLPEC